MSEPLPHVAISATARRPRPASSSSTSPARWRWRSCSTAIRSSALLAHPPIRPALVRRLAVSARPDVQPVPAARAALPSASPPRGTGRRISRGRRSVVKRLRRFGLFVVLGYALHLPVPPVRGDLAGRRAKWRAFLAVDVLQLIGVTSSRSSCWCSSTRSRRVFMVVTLVLAAAMVLVTPAVWDVDWARRLPPFGRGLFSQASGSLFPLFPWMAFILLGAGLGQLYARWGAAICRLCAAGAHLAAVWRWCAWPPRCGRRTICSDRALATSCPPRSAAGRRLPDSSWPRSPT